MSKRIVLTIVKLYTPLLTDKVINMFIDEKEFAEKALEIVQ